MRQTRLAIISLTAAAVSAVAGCTPTQKTANKSDANGVDTCQGMITYLRSRRLPALHSVDPWNNDYGPGLKLTTAHYKIYTTLLEPLMLSELPGFVESAYHGYNNQLPQPVETDRKFTTYLFAERSQWEEFTDHFAAPHTEMYKKIKAGAYYLNGACVTYNIGRERTFSVLGHEGWHQFNTRHFHYRLPSWLDEGLAMMFEASRYEDGLFYFEPQRNLYRLGALKQTLRKNKMIPLVKLIAMNPGEALVKSDDTVAAFYGQSYALVRFLKEEDYGRRLPQFHQMLMGAVRGRWPLDKSAAKIAADRNIPLTVGWNRTIGLLLFRHYITEDLHRLEDKYLRFCRKIVYHVRLKK